MKNTSQKPRLLIVEDEIDIQEILKFLFVDKCEVDCASDGLEAIELLKANYYHTILSDINMPKMDGFGLLEWVRSEGLLSPFIVLTAHGEKEMAIRALRLGAVDFVDKPWTQADLEERVHSALELGVEYERWSDFEGEISDLQDVGSNVSKQAMAELLKRDMGKSGRRKKDAA